jgi:hypothetical protein
MWPSAKTPLPMESLPTGLCRWPRQIAISKAFVDGNLSFTDGG